MFGYKAGFPAMAVSALLCTALSIPVLGGENLPVHKDLVRIAADQAAMSFAADRRDG